MPMDRMQASCSSSRLALSTSWREVVPLEVRPDVSPPASATDVPCGAVVLFGAAACMRRQPGKQTTCAVSKGVYGCVPCEMGEAAVQFVSNGGMW